MPRSCFLWVWKPPLIGKIILLQATHPIPEPIWPLKMLSSRILYLFFTSSLFLFSSSSPSMQRKVLIFHSCGNPFNIGPLFYYVETLKMCCSYNRTTCPVPYHLQTVKMVPHISFFKAEYMWRQSLVTYIKNISKWKLHWGVSGCAHLMHYLSSILKENPWVYDLFNSK